MNKKNYALFLIDVQNDFIDQDGASLSVHGALTACDRITNFINSNGNKISYISLSADQHHPIHIGNHTWFMDKEGNVVLPFTEITSQDLKNGKYVAKYHPLPKFS